MKINQSPQALPPKKNLKDTASTQSSGIGVDPSIETRKDESGNTLYKITTQYGNEKWSLLPYDVDWHNGADGNKPLDPSQTPGEARKGIAGMHNGVFVNEHGVPVHHRVPEDWMPPSWIPEIAPGNASVWHEDYNTLVRTNKPAHFGPGMSIIVDPADEKPGIPDVLNNPTHPRTGYARVLEDPVTGFWYLEGPPRDTIANYFRPGHPEDAFGKGTYAADQSDFPFADYPWIDDGSPDFFERFRAWQKANPNAGLSDLKASGEYSPTMRTSDSRLPTSRAYQRRMERLNQSGLENPANVPGKASVENDADDSLSTILMALLAKVLMNRSGSLEDPVGYGNLAASMNRLNFLG